MPRNIAIIGSGFLGLTLALRLAENGDHVTIFESADKIGGLASAWSIGDYTWDKHYHVTLGSDTYTRKIVEELGLGDEFNWVQTKTGFYTDGQLHSMSNLKEFLGFPPLGLVGKLRLGASIFYASRIGNWRKLEKTTVERWLTRISGKQVFDRIWRPLLKAKLGEAYRETSAAFIWATIKRMYAARETGQKTEKFGYVTGGYSRILERFVDVLLDKGVEIRLNSGVASVERSANGKILVTTAATRRRNDKKKTIVSQRSKYASFSVASTVAAGFSGGFLSEPQLDLNGPVRMPSRLNVNHFDRVVLTCPSTVAADIVTGLTSDETERLANIRYQGIVCASVLMKCSLSKYYVTNITDDAPFTGVIEMTALVDKREFGRNALVYLPKYVAPDDELFEMSDDEIKRTFLNALERMYPHFRRKDVLEFKVSRARQVFPLPVLNYSQNAPEQKTSVDGVFVVNSSHILNGTLNVNETVQLAERFFSEHLDDGPNSN